MGVKKVLVVLGHPSGNSLCAALAQSYAQAARQAGHDVRELHLGEMNFDLSLRHGYQRDLPLEPVLAAAQQDIEWAQHICWVYPVWWGSIPALLKGFLDRVLLPGFAFRYERGSSIPAKLLRGRSAQLLVTLDTPQWYFRWWQGAPAVRQMKITTLEFCGIRPVAVQLFGPVISSSPAARERWLERAAKLGAALR